MSGRFRVHDAECHEKAPTDSLNAITRETLARASVNRLKSAAPNGHVRRMKKRALIGSLSLSLSLFFSFSFGSLSTRRSSI